MPAFCGAHLKDHWVAPNKREAMAWLRRNHPGSVFMAVDDREDQLESMGARWSLMMPSRYADRVDRRSIPALPDQPLIWMRAVLRDLRFTCAKFDKRLTDLTARETLARTICHLVALDLGFTEPQPALPDSDLPRDDYPGNDGGSKRRLPPASLAGHQ